MLSGMVTRAIGGRILTRDQIGGQHQRQMTRERQRMWTGVGARCHGLVWFATGSPQFEMIGALRGRERRNRRCHHARDAGVVSGRSDRSLDRFHAPPLHGASDRPLRSH